MTKVTQKQVSHIAQLANIPITDKEEQELAQAFSDTLDVVDHLKTADTKNTEPTHQVTGLENILREDIVDDSRTFSQSEALANAKKTHKGYFVVPRIIDQD